MPWAGVVLSELLGAVPSLTNTRLMAMSTTVWPKPGSPVTGMRVDACATDVLAATQMRLQTAAALSAAASNGLRSLRTRCIFPPMLRQSSILGCLSIYEWLNHHYPRAADDEARPRTRASSAPTGSRAVVCRDVYGHGRFIRPREYFSATAAAGAAFGR